MPSVMVDIAPVVLDWVLKSTHGTSIDNVVIENLIRWKNGERKPTFNQIESISKATRIPLGYFFLQAPPIENFPILQYRTIESLSAHNPSRDLIDTIHDMENIQEWMRNHMIDSGNDKLHYVGSLKGVDDKQHIVSQILSILSIRADWYTSDRYGKIRTTADAFKLFRSRLEKSGAIIMASGIVGSNTHRSLSIEEFRAFTLVDDYAPLIFINSNDSHGAKLFSLLHETAHILLGINNFYNDRYGNAEKVNDMEVLCNAVAAEILVPTESFRFEWDKRTDSEWLLKIQQLANLFHCGTIVVARKALDNHLIDKNQYQAVVDEAIRQFNDLRKKATGGDYYVTAASRIDNRFIIALDNSIREGRTLFTDAYKLTNTNRKTFAALVEEVRGIS